MKIKIKNWIGKVKNKDIQDLEKEKPEFFLGSNGLTYVILNSHSYHYNSLKKKHLRKIKKQIENPIGESPKKLWKKFVGSSIWDFLINMGDKSSLLSSVENYVKSLYSVYSDEEIPYGLVELTTVIFNYIKKRLNK